VARWTAADAPDQPGRTALVTGANSGLGLETARVLAHRGVTVVLACRNVDAAVRAADRIHGDAPHARLEIRRLDLASLRSVREAAGEIRSAHARLHLLINNAGVMDVPHGRTEDGFERTLGTNHLGHFALTGLLMETLLATEGSRVVTVSSLAHRRGVIRFDDLQSEQGYDRGKAYAQSKLANLLFTYELEARLEACSGRTMALAAHPGNASTALWRTSSRVERAFMSPRLRLLTSWLVQSAEQGALPTLRAALGPDARGGEYYGPGGRGEFTGYPVRVESSERSHDAADRRRLWAVSEELTGVAYDALVPSRGE
jgi:NAD(P)-dependent dehydrogenase (short-subunit alcohol dehydrogenase family)